MSSASDLPTGSFRLYKESTAVNIEGIGTPGQKATGREVWRVPMAARTAALNVVLGKPEVVGGWGGVVVRLVPLRHPEYPDVLLASSASSKGVGFDATTHFWKYVDIAVSFESRPYATSGQDAFLSRSGQPDSRGFPGPAAGFRLNGNPPQFDPGEEIDGESVSFTTHNLPTLPTAAYDSVRNCVNSAVFYGRAIGTVRYNGPQYSETSTLGGPQMWEVSHSFSYSKVPWNSYYAADGGSYPLTRADGTYKYPLADLTTVFSA